MSLTLREKIGAWLLTTLNALDGVSAYRPKHIHWTDELTVDGAVMIRQAALRFTHEDPAAVVAEQDYEIAVVARDSDSVATALDTRLNAKWAAIIPALAADPSCGGNAMYGGMVLGGIDPLLDEHGGKLAEVLTLTVQFSMEPDDLTAVAIR